MKASTSSRFLSRARTGVLAWLFVIVLVSGGSVSASQEQSGFLETVGGETTRELPPSESYDADTNGSLDLDELSLAVRDRYPKIIWPEAQVVPVDDIIADLESSGETTWEIGSEFRALEIPAVCAWLTAYMEVYASGNTFHQSAALDQLSYVLGGSRSLTDEEFEGVVSAMRYARLGDVEPLRAFMADGMCDVNAAPSPVSSPAGLADRSLG